MNLNDLARIGIPILLIFAGIIFFSAKPKFNIYAYFSFLALIAWIYEFEVGNFHANIYGYYFIYPHFWAPGNYITAALIPIPFIIVNNISDPDPLGILHEHEKN